MEAHAGTSRAWPVLLWLCALAWVPLAACGPAGPEEPASASRPRPSEADAALQAPEPGSAQGKEGGAAAPAETPAAPDGDDEADGDDEPEEPAEEDGQPDVAGGALDGAVIAIDPGHNGGNAAHPEVVTAPVDAGGFTKACNTVGAATDDGDSEARVNLEVSLALHDLLTAEGATVHLSREDDDGVGPCIDERGRFAGEVGADLLVSVHADGAAPQAHGFHVIRPGLVEGYTEGIVEESAVLAEAVRDALRAGGLTPATYVGEAGLVERRDLGTLNNATVPAVLVELGNLRHAGDAALLTDPGGQGEVAGHLLEGLAGYLAGR
ncbi:MAG: N-acetylmuramoyl-L-alanine amidase [Egibacteraceae bacterium]